MCRLLLMKSEQTFEVRPLLEAFAEMCQASREYQGDGWGVFLRSNGESQVRRSTEPIWTGDFSELGSANMLLAHARSAFRGGEISLDQTMPFTSGEVAFAFNGELHDVRLRAEGRNGAQKIFSLTSRLMSRDPSNGFRRAMKAIRNHSGHIRALNVVMTVADRIYCCSTFSQEPDYFTLHTRRSNGMVTVCSEPLPGYTDWSPMPNNAVEVFQ